MLGRCKYDFVHQRPKIHAYYIKQVHLPSVSLDQFGFYPPSNNYNDKDKGPGWMTVPNNDFNKFTMKRSPAKKYLEPGATVIYINTKVSYGF